MEKKSNLSRLLGYAGGHRYLLYASWLLSAVSALVALVPFLYIWRIMQEVLETAPDFGNAQGMTHNGWMAVLFSVLAVLIYIAGLMCSHMGAFRVATNLRLETMRHIVRLPLGYAERFGTRNDIGLSHIHHRVGLDQDGFTVVLQHNFTSGVQLGLAVNTM